MSNLSKKIIATITAITVSVWLMGPGVASALTIAELQAQIDALLATLATLQAELTALQGQEGETPAACSGITFDRNLKQGMSGNDVKCLQALLNQSADTQLAASGVGSSGNETTYFGPLTKAAVIKFQEKYASEVLTPIGLTAGTGFVGTYTRAKLNSLLVAAPPAEISSVSPVNNATAVAVSTNVTATFAADLDDTTVTTLTVKVVAGSTEIAGTVSYASKVITFDPTSNLAYSTQYTATLNKDIKKSDGTAALTADYSWSFTTAGAPVAGENKVELAADNPAAATVAKGAQNVIFAKMNFCAASEANTVSKIVLSRGGIGNDSDISYVKLYEGATQVGSTQSINSTTHTATFASLNWTITANTCKVLTAKASISGTATQGNTIKFQITSASDITSTVALDGVFPISSNGMTVAGIAAGYLEVATTSPSGGSVIAGGVEQDIAGFNLTASSGEAVKVHSVKLTQMGSITDSDISNIKLFYGSTQIGSTVAGLTNGKATFDLSAAPFEILAGGNKTLKVTVDIGSSTGIKNRTIAFEVSDNTYITAYGANSGGSLVIYGATQATDLWPQNSAPVTISLGSLTVTKDETNSPSAQDYAKGTLQNSIIAFKFTTGANEAVRITQIKLQETVSALRDSDVANVTLYDAVTGAQLLDTAGNPVPAVGMVSGYITFGSYTTGLDTTGLIDIPKSSSKVVIVKADIPTGASSTDSYLGFKINNPTTDIKADGLSSQNDLGASEINGGTTTNVPSTNLLHDIIANGTLTVSANSNTPAAATYAVGTTDFVFALFDLVSVGENITISQLNVLFATDTTAVATTTAADAADVNNIRLYDGSTLLKTDSVISSGKAEFGINFTVPKNTTKTIKVVGDIPVGSDAANLTAHIDSSSYLTAAGADSAQTITASAASWSVHGNLMTKGAPTLTVTAAVNPVAQTFIKNTAGAHVTTLYFAASAAEDIKLTRVKILGDATTSATAAGPHDFGTADATDTLSIVRNMTGNIKLYDGSTQIGNTVPSMTDAANYDYADFTGLSLLIPKGQTKALDVKLDVLNSTTGSYFYFGISSSSEITASGQQSGTVATISVATGGVAGKKMTFGSSGTLTVALDTNSPISAEIIEGTTVDVGKWKFTATNEAINITRLTFDVQHSDVALGASLASGVPSLTNVLATSSDTYAFIYSLDDGATTTCVWKHNCNSAGCTTTDFIARTINSDDAGTSTCGTVLNVSTTSAGYLSFAATSSGRSIEIRDAETTASNTVDNFLVGLKYGGTESIGAAAGDDKNVIKASLYDGSTWLADAYIDAVRTDRLEFGCDDCATLVTAPYPGNKVLTLKAQLAAYSAAVEGSTIYFRLGTSTAASDTDYIYGKGASSGTALATSTILSSTGAVGAIGALESGTMYLAGSKPVVSLNSAAPSGLQSPNSNGEVFRFDVTAPSTGFDVNINAIRFNISTNATSYAWDRAYNLYKSTNLTSVLGRGVSFASASTSNTGYVAIYPDPAVVGDGTTATYVLKADTSVMDTKAGTDQLLIISIEDGDFYWDEGLAGNVRDKVLNLPVTGNTLRF